MVLKRREQGIKPHLSSRKPGQGNKTTILPPKHYLKLNNNEETQTPNLINIYRHDYKSKHFQFGTSLLTTQYQDELTQVMKHCTDMMRELNMTDEDRS